MTIYTEGRHPAEYIASEANGTRSREVATLLAGNNLPAGAVLARFTSGINTGKYTAVNPASVAGDGSDDAAAILFAATDATAADVSTVITARDTEVKALVLGWPVGTTAPQKTAALAQLAAFGIVAR